MSASNKIFSTTTFPVVLGSPNSIPQWTPPGATPNTVVWILPLPAFLTGQKATLTLNTLRAVVTCAQGASLPFNIILGCPSLTPQIGFNNSSMLQYICAASMNTISSPTLGTIDMKYPKLWDVSSLSGQRLNFYVYSSTANGSATLVPPSTMITSDIGTVYAQFVLEIYQLPPPEPSPSPCPCPVPCPQPQPTPTPNPFDWKKFQIAKRNPRAKIPTTDSKGNIQFYLPEDIVIKRGQTRFVQTGWDLISVPQQYQLVVMPEPTLLDRGMHCNLRIVDALMPGPCSQGLYIQEINIKFGGIIATIGMTIANAAAADIALGQGSLIFKGVSWLGSKIISFFRSENADIPTIIQYMQTQRSKCNKNSKRAIMQMQQEANWSGPFKKIKM